MKYGILAGAGAIFIALAIQTLASIPSVALALAALGSAMVVTAFLTGGWWRGRGKPFRQFQRLVEEDDEGKAVTADGVILYANPAFARLVGISPDELTGRPLEQYLSDSGTETTLTNDNGERTLLCQDGTPVPIHLKTNPVRISGKDLQLVFARDIRAQRAAEEQIRALNEYMDSIIDNADIWLNTLDDEGRIVIWNKAAERISGYRREDVVGRSDIWLQLYPDATYRDFVFSRAMDILQRGSVEMDLVTTIRTRFGRQVTLNWNSRMLTNASGAVVGSIALARDVTLERKAQESLRLHASVFETADPIAITTPEGVVLKVNQAFTRTFGYPEEAITGRSLRDLHVPQSDEVPHQRIWSTLEVSDQWSGELLERCADGRLMPVHLTLSTVRDDQGTITHYVGHWQDISERKEFEEKIQHQALYDPLTGLPNRRLIISRLAQELGRARRIGGFGALLFVDLDRFKQINDVHGHDVGDTMLGTLARRLQSVLRTEDMAARLGGDEFVILVGAEVGGRDATLIRAERVAEKILMTIREPVEVGGYHLSVSASAGLALYPDKDMTPEQLLQRADSAMYSAKEKGRDGIHFFSDALQQRAQQRQNLYQALIQALDDGHIEVHYQPIAATDGTLRAIEAMVRWPGLEAQGMDAWELTAVAEQTGLLGRIDRQVLQTACNDMAQWGRLGLLPESCSLVVNLSYSLLMQEQFAADLALVLERTGTPAARLVLDIEESIFQDQHPALESTMTTLSQLGIRFAVDNFGAGHSSLTQLSRLPVSTLKIDESHIGGLPDDKTSVAVLEACLGVGQSLNLEVVAKGLCTREQLETLVARGCSLFQGPFISSDLTAEALERVFQTGGMLESQAENAAPDRDGD